MYGPCPSRQGIYLLAFNLCALRAFVLNCLNYRKVQAKKAALEAFSFNPLSALRFLGLHTKDV